MKVFVVLGFGFMEPNIIITMPDNIQGTIKYEYSIISKVRVINDSDPNEEEFIDR